jgi:membrane-associated phospholipid phosphatase
MSPRTISAVLCLVLVPAALARADDEVYSNSDTEHAGQLGAKLVENIFADQKHIWTSPFHANHDNAKWWLLFTGATAALIASDHTTINTFRNAPTQISYGNNLSKVGSAYTVVPVTAAFYLGGVFTHDAKARETGVLGAEALVDALIVQSVLKPIAGRSRPNATRDKNEWFDGGASFPSGHAIQSWALASVISHEYSDRKWVPWVVYGAAGVVSAARFTAQQHYASDIVAGGAMGWFIGHYVVNHHGEHVGHGGKPKLAPIMSPSTRTYGISLAFAR